METLAAHEITEDETREIISLMKDDAQKQGKPIAHLGPFVRTVASNGDLPEHLARVRAAAARRAAYAAHQAAPPPDPDPEPTEPSTTPEEAAAARAAVREALRGSQVRKGEKGPTRLLKPRQAPEEVPAEVQAAHAYLTGRGDFDSHMIAAREKLGPDAPRDEVVVLAADLARSAG